MIISEPAYFGASRDYFQNGLLVTGVTRS